MLIVGVCGRTGSGKSTFAKRLKDRLCDADITVGVLSMDDFYLELDEADHLLALKNEYDFDCLESFDVPRMLTTLKTIKAGHALSFNKYDHANHKHQTAVTTFEPCNVWIIEGLYLFAIPEVVALFDLKVYMQVDSDVSLLRRVRRDIVQRRRDVDGVLQQYERYVKPAYHKLVAPSRSVADICVMNGAYNEPAFDSVYHFIIAHVKQ